MYHSCISLSDYCINDIFISSDVAPILIYCACCLLFFRKGICLHDLILLELYFQFYIWYSFNGCSQQKLFISYSFNYLFENKLRKEENFSQVVSSCCVLLFFCLQRWSCRTSWRPPTLPVLGMRATCFIEKAVPALIVHQTKNSSLHDVQRELEWMPRARRTYCPLPLLTFLRLTCSCWP